MVLTDKKIANDNMCLLIQNDNYAIYHVFNVVFFVVVFFNFFLFCCFVFFFKFFLSWSLFQDRHVPINYDTIRDERCLILTHCE